MEKSPSFTWSTRSDHTARGYFDPYDDLRALRKQQKILRRQAWALEIYRDEKHYEYWDLAEQHGCVFPFPEDEQKCWEVYKDFDKATLPRDVVAFSDLMHLGVALRKHEKCLVKQIRQLRRAKCKEVCSRVLGDISSVPGEMRGWLNHVFRSNAGLSSAKGYKKVV